MRAAFAKTYQGFSTGVRSFLDFGGATRATGLVIDLVERARQLGAAAFLTAGDLRLSGFFGAANHEQKEDRT